MSKSAYRQAIVAKSVNAISIRTGILTSSHRFATKQNQSFTAIARMMAPVSRMVHGLTEPKCLNRSANTRGVKQNRETEQERNNTVNQEQVLKTR